MIKISYKMHQYHEDIKELIENEDTIIELGCHVGKTTEYILKGRNVNIISLDNSPEAKNPMKKLETQYPNLKFITGDVRLHETLISVKKLIEECDILSIDLGGGYHPDTVFKVYYIWSSTFKPKHTLIRNRGLIDFINTSKTNETIKSKEGYLESCENMGIPPQVKEFTLWSEKL